MKNIIIALIVVVLIGVGVYYFNRNTPEALDTTPTDQTTQQPTDQTDQMDETQDQEPEDETETVIGQSAGDHDITAYHYGTGDTELLFVGGIHGGYSWNTALVAYELMDYLEENPGVVPQNVRVTVIPVLNPDGLEKVTGETERFTAADARASSVSTELGRFNANNVDLNRNFECDWQANATWQDKAVSGGAEAFSEPEAQAIRSYVQANDPDAVVVWYSAAGGVFASSCHNGVLPKTTEITNLYADASGYPAYESFDFYAITGDMVNWLAKEGVPAISVLLTNHTDVEWSKNKAGIDALLGHYAE